jgi:hypothetical protein
MSERGQAGSEIRPDAAAGDGDTALSGEGCVLVLNTLCFSTYMFFSTHKSQYAPVAKFEAYCADSQLEKPLEMRAHQTSQ